jgi:hypothetical protein
VVHRRCISICTLTFSKCLSVSSGCLLLFRPALKRLADSDSGAGYGLDVALSSGVYSLIGVVVGGGVTWATQWRLAARSDRLDTRVARRKIGAELRRHRPPIARAVLQRTPNSQELLDQLLGELAQTGSEAWEEHSNRLARQLPDQDWDAVERAYGSIAELISTIREYGIPPTVQDFAQSRNQIDDALSRLSASGLGAFRRNPTAALERWRQST